MNKHILKLIILLILSSCNSVTPPKPYGPLPKDRQLEWHKMEYYGFLHFNMNTFTNIEWGGGGESPKLFNPIELDTRQWARVAKEAGMKGLILTAKHHDGFCLWPSKYTEHSIKNSPWKDGKGDVLQELAEACREYGLKMGVYLSPWDRNHAAYGSPEYVKYFQNQLRELLTNYGDIFEVWFDGANGGSGYYGGANETRKIDNKTYYQWDKAIEIIRELQPNAVIFGDGGPGVRWIGNEEGWANETNWSLLRKDKVYPGYKKFIELRSGHEDGTHWVPGEADVSIRPGWYYHPYEDYKVKTLPHLLDIYYQSVGRNASLLLNLPVDNRGLVHEEDVKQLMALRNQLDKDFKKNLAKNIKITATNVRGKSSEYKPENVIDGNNDTYWATDDGIIKASITLEFNKPTEINRILLQEYIPLGQRVKAFTVEGKVDNTWVTIDKQTTIGYKRILRFKTVKVSELRVTITDSKALPVLSNIELYRAPNLLTTPKITRNKQGLVTIDAMNNEVETYYTVNGETPTLKATKYIKPFLIEKPTTIKVFVYDPKTKQKTVVSSKYFDSSKKKWKVIRTTYGDLKTADRMIDDNESTYWNAKNKPKEIQEVIIDLGEEKNIKGFTYTPMQARDPWGIITKYQFSVGKNKRKWKTVAKGEFGNILNNPIEQLIRFKNIKGRYIKLRGLKVGGKNSNTAFGEIGLITE